MSKKTAKDNNSEKTSKLSQKRTKKRETALDKLKAAKPVINPVLMPIVPKPFKKMYLQYCEQLNYVFFGCLTTAVNFALFAILSGIFNVDIVIANIISWVISVTCAYLSNRYFVFTSKVKGQEALREAVLFFVGRLFTLGIETVILKIFVDNFGFNKILVKAGAIVSTVIINYVIGKLIVFKPKED